MEKSNPTISRKKKLVNTSDSNTSPQKAPEVYMETVSQQEKPW